MSSSQTTSLALHEKDYEVTSSRIDLSWADVPTTVDFRIILSYWQDQD